MGVVVGVAAAAAAEEAAAAVAGELKDCVGMGYRTDLAAEILRWGDEIDILEVIADDYFDAPAKKVRALQTLSAQIPIMLHGVSLGMSSTVRVSQKRLEKMARLLDRLANFSWSEHLAFVRAGEIEIGHLAFPPRTQSSIEGTAENLFLARKVVGTSPSVENVATLLDPPGSTMSEATWLCEILLNSSSDLLLDLHNVHTNSVNLGFDPYELLDSLPGNRISTIHISGGKVISAVDDMGRTVQRVLDDHLHDVDDDVYSLLEYAAAKCDQPLTVILERDGNYPSMEELLAQLRKARVALKRGREMKRAA